jgi:hypothetical protein
MSAVATMSARDTAAAVAEVLAPTIAKGVIIRRPGVVSLAERFDADSRAVRRMQRLRATYGPGPVLLRVPGRDVALVLAEDHVKRILTETPEPFAAATREKQAALAHFQPHGVLASHGAPRADRRRFNEQVLGSQLPVHGMADRLLEKVTEEAEILASKVAATGRLTWPDYIEAWYRMVRRVVLGDAARDDHALTDYLADLRAAANFAFLRPKPTELRRRFFRQLQGHLDRAEPGSLAGLMAQTPTTEQTRPAEQVPQWLFAYDAAAWASFRTLALLGSHPAQAARARSEIAGQPAGAAQHLEYLRACMLESLRLWPTTPVVLRESTIETRWETGELPAGTNIVIFAPLFHRDGDHLPHADAFAADGWLGHTGGEGLGNLTDDDWPLIPFSAGPAVCPGRNLVLLTATSMLASLLARHELRLEDPDRLGPDAPLPGSLSPFDLTFAASMPGSAA